MYYCCHLTVIHRKNWRRTQTKHRQQNRRNEETRPEKRDSSASSFCSFPPLFLFTILFSGLSFSPMAQEAETVALLCVRRNNQVDAVDTTHKLRKTKQVPRIYDRASTLRVYPTCQVLVYPTTSCRAYHMHVEELQREHCACMHNMDRTQHRGERTHNLHAYIMCLRKPALNFASRFHCKHS